MELIVAQLVEGMQDRHKGLISIINIAKPGHCGAYLYTQHTGGGSKRIKNLELGQGDGSVMHMETILTTWI